MIRQKQKNTRLGQILDWGSRKSFNSKNSCKYVIFLLSAMLVLSVLGDDWEAKRFSALNRKREVIYNNDGDDALHFPVKQAATKENFLKQRLVGAANTRIDSVFYSPGPPIGPLSTRTDVVDRCVNGPEPEFPQYKNITRILHQQGTDPLELVVNFCKQNHMEIFVSFRMNDTHDGSGSFAKPHYLMSKFKLDHPECLLGLPDKRPPICVWSAVNYAKKPVRDRIAAAIKETVERYDVDGIEYDFMRHIQFFKSVAYGKTASEQELKLMTDFMRRLRKITEEAGRKRGRPILVAARLPDSVGYCRAVGVDLEKWLSKRLIDIYIGGSYFQLNPYRKSVELAHKYGVKFYPSLDESRIHFSLPPGGRNSFAAYSARALAALSEGCDGIYYFNIYGEERQANWLRGNVKDLAHLEKIYYATELDSGYIIATHYLHNGQHFGTLPLLTPDRPIGISSKNGFSFELVIGDDFSKATPQVEAVVLAEIQEDAQLKLSVNGKNFFAARRNGEYFFFPIDPAALKRGTNRFAITVSESGSASVMRTILDGKYLLTGAKQPPWRRLWQAHNEKHAEEIVDGSYRIIDSGSRGNECANLLYPLTGRLGNQPLAGTFELQVERSDTPQAVVFRVADGKNVEMVTFEPDKISLKFAGKSRKLNTTDKFHHYGFKLADGMFTFTADGKQLFKEPAKPVAHPRTKLAGNELQIPGMNECSILIGSLSGSGKSSSRWRGLAVEGCLLFDFCLHISYPQKNQFNIKW